MNIKFTQIMAAVLSASLMLQPVAATGATVSGQTVSGQNKVSGNGTSSVSHGSKKDSVLKKPEPSVNAGKSRSENSKNNTVSSERPSSSETSDIEISGVDSATVQKFVPLTVSGQVRNGLVSYADQTGTITAGQKKITLELGEMQKLSFSGVDDVHDIAFISNKPSVVQVDIDGNAYAIMAGTATITAWYNGKKAKTRVKVPKKTEKGTINVLESYTGNGNKEKQVKVKGAKKTDVTISTEDISTSSKDPNGNEYNINRNLVTVTSSYGTVSYISYPENPTAVNTSVTIGVGETKTLVTEGVAEGIIWKTNKKKIAQVDALGRVTGIKAGTAKIVAKIGKKKLTYNITVDASKEPDPVSDSVVTQVRLNRFTSVNLSSSGHILAVVKTDSYNSDDMSPYSKTYEDGFFVYTIIYNKSGGDSVKITGLTEEGLKQSLITVPAQIAGKNVTEIKSAFDVDDVYFNSDFNISAIPSDLSERIYTNGDFKYLYKIQEDELVVEIRGLSAQGKTKNSIYFPAKINDRRVVLVSDAALSDCVGKDVDFDPSIPNAVDSNTISDFAFNKENFIYHFETKSGSMVAIIDGLSESGKVEDNIGIPSQINNYNVAGIKDKALSDAENKDVMLDNGIGANVLPETLNNHTFASSEGFVYKYNIKNKEIVAEIIGVTEPLTGKTTATVPAILNNKNVSKVTDGFLDPKKSGIENPILNEVNINAIPNNIHDYLYNTELFYYRYYIVTDENGDKALKIELVGLTEEGKKRDSLEIPSEFNGVKVGKIDDELLNEPNIVISDDIKKLIGVGEKQQTEDFIWHRELDENNRIIAVIDDITEKGKAKNPLVIPGTISGTKVEGISDKVLDPSKSGVSNIKFDKDIDINAIPDNINDYTYNDGTFEYKYYVDTDEDGNKTLKVELVDLTEQGKKQNTVEVPSEINGTKVGKIDDTLLDNPNVVINDKDVQELLGVGKQYQTDGLLWHRELSDGTLVAIIDDVADKTKSPLVIPGTLGGNKVAVISDKVLDPSVSGVNNIDLHNVDVNVIPDNISDYIYNDGIFKYRYYKDTDENGKTVLKVEVIDLTDEAKLLDSVNLPTEINGTPVGKINPVVLDNGNIRIPENSEIRNLINTDTTYQSEGLVWHRELSGNMIVAVIDDVTSEGKTKDPLWIPSSLSGNIIKSISDKILNPSQSGVGNIGFKDVNVTAIPDNINDYSYTTEDTFVYGYVKKDGKLYAVIEDIKDTAIAAYKASGEKVTLPSQINGTPVLNVLPDVFDKLKNEGISCNESSFTLRTVKAVTITVSGNGKTTKSPDIQEAAVEYGDLIVPEDFNVEIPTGYHVGYYTNENLTTEYNFDNEVKVDFTIYIGIKANTDTRYTVNFYFEEVDMSTGEHLGYVENERAGWSNSGDITDIETPAVIYTGTSGTDTNIEAPAFTGYKPIGYTTTDKSSMQKLASGKGSVYIHADGSAEINFYYDVESLKLIYKIGNGVQFVDLSEGSDGKVRGQGNYRKTVKYLQNIVFAAFANGGGEGVAITSNGSPVKSRNVDIEDKYGVSNSARRYSFTMGSADTTVILSSVASTNTIDYVYNNPNNENNITIIDADGKTTTNPSYYTVGSTTKLNNLKKTGYRFLGWTGTDPGTGSNISTPSKNVQISYTELSDTFTFLYTANWEPIEYEVKFDANGGTGVLENEHFKYDEVKPLTANDFTRTGYTFLGWSTDKDATSASYINMKTVSNMTSEDNSVVTLYAVWQANTYTLTFNANGANASCSETSRDVVYGKAYGTLPVPTRTGYSFTGWFTSINGDTEVTSATIMGSKDATLYAHWEINACAITINVTKDSDIGCSGAFKVTYMNSAGESTTTLIHSGDTVRGVAKDQSITIQAPSSGYTHNGSDISNAALTKTWTINSTSYAENPVTYIPTGDTTVTLVLVKNPAFFG